MRITGLHRSQDVLVELVRAYRKLGPKGTLTISYPNPLQQTLNPKAGPNWLAPETMTTLLSQAGFAKLAHGWWFGLPGTQFAKTLSQGLLARLVCPMIYFIAEKQPLPQEKNYSVSVIIPCKDEEGNIARAVKSVPKLGRFTEVVVVDDGSTDQTAQIVKNLKLKIKNLKLISYQPNRGKRQAVTAGFKSAKGEIVMIWDADMTVPASELELFITPLRRGIAQLTNGARFIYPMQEKAMKRTNFVGNKLMSLLFSWVLGQHVTDTLCGNKALFKKDWLKIKMMPDDPWGDFSLLLGASRLGLKIQDVPVHYLARTAGASKMKTIQHGLYLLKAALKGLVFLKLRF